MQFNPKNHTGNSSYREKLVEHLFVAELLKVSWLHHGCSLELAKPEVDNAGYDLIAEMPGCVRHIQLKSSKTGATTASQKIHTKLAQKSSGCVIWIYVDENTLRLGPFLYFGAGAGKPLPSLEGHKTATHTKGNRYGVKAPRPNIRVVKKGCFQKCASIEDLFIRLFHTEMGLPAEKPVCSGSALKTSSLPTDVLPIALFPADPATFKNDLLRSRRAKIEITYSDGSTKEKDWNADRLDTSSNVIGNLRSRPEFRNGKWQAFGIVQIVVRVTPPARV